MEQQMEWQDSYSIGVDLIDKEHQRLFKIINKLFVMRAEEKDSHWMCQEGIKFFKGHTVKHFADEEKYMESIGYEGLEQHRKVHQTFRESTLPALEQELIHTDYSSSAVDHFLSVCAGWLIGHTLTEDQAINGGRISQWTNLLPEEEQAVMKEIIVQLIFDMFHLEAKVISDAYGGEKFGHGVYYRLIFSTPDQKERQVIILAFEESLLINTVGRIIGIQSNRLDSMLMNAVRYTARQFVHRVQEHFPEDAELELQEENLLTYEQFRRIFEQYKPQMSLLMNTGGAGYFAYCVFGAHRIQTDHATPLKHENAMAEVTKYLAKREEEEETDEPKDRILVVDDSATIRQAMKKLLEEDYEVLLAESGVAAIRAITLDRPDMVLLDYEMPVCNGKQTLEMLRSEDAFANIPVVFLTGRSDPNLVRELLALKPMGYLLKYLKPAEIKEKIDKFFEKIRA
ncbi:MAG: response regulator [Oscillibacter sp.]|jgi:hemerythrin-like metal-binding protein|nr:response regulator [Oscillibacter sp.]